MVLGVIDFIFENKYPRSLPYGFDYVAELESYKMIGKKKKGKLAYYDKFSTWKFYIEQEYDDRKNNENFYRFLNRKLREKKDEKELMLNLMIPADITLITVFFTVKSIMDEMEIVISVSGLSLFFVISLTMKIWRVNEEIYFIEDFIFIFFPELYIDMKPSYRNQDQQELS